MAAARKQSKKTAKKTAGAKKYSLGIDFGTESGRCVLVDVTNGKELATAVLEYPHGVIDETLPGTNKKLPHDWALQHPGDYIEVLKKTVPQALRKAKVKKGEIIGIGIDFTACTCLPVDRQGTPLCFQTKWAKEPHAWIKLWKHHASQPQADRINEIAHERGESWIQYFGGKLSSEWMLAKVLQVIEEKPQVYDAADRFMEAADWVIMQLTGVEARNSCTAGYKAQYVKGEGYPGKDFFRALHPKMESFVEEKLSEEIWPLGRKAGELTPEMAREIGLEPGVAVAVANVDAHVSVPAATITTPGKMLMIMGTSICHVLMGNERKYVPGICGVVEDGVLEGFYGYEAGQSGAGDILAWFVNNCVPAAYEAEARKRKLSVHELLTEKAAAKDVGECGVLALDWINGNRSVLVDADLTGMFVGMNMQTRPEDLYRALVESLAFGTYKIVNTFEEHGVPVKELYACGGLPERNPFLMQVFADVTGRTIKISASGQTCALGAAMFGAVAAGKSAGGYDTVTAAAKKMAKLKQKVYRPQKQRHARYQQIYAEYERCHDWFGRGPDTVMKNVKQIKQQAMA
jgi:L-ribulokinase